MQDRDTVFLGAAECIYVEEVRSCVECLADCHTVEICFEAPFCSEECLAKWDDDYWSTIYEGVYPSTWQLSTAI